MQQLTVSVHYWRHQNTGPLIELAGSMPALKEGWYCWAFPSDDNAFELWLSAVCPTADVTYRFNSGNPMYSVYISDAKEALIFQLTWQ